MKMGYIDWFEERASLQNKYFKSFKAYIIHFFPKGLKPEDLRICEPDECDEYQIIRMYIRSLNETPDVDGYYDRIENGDRYRSKIIGHISHIDEIIVTESNISSFGVKVYLPINLNKLYSLRYIYVNPYEVESIIERIKMDEL